MAEGFKSKIVNNMGIFPINPLQCGIQHCPAEYSFGPSIRDFWILHFVISGKGVLLKDGSEHSVKENEIFVIRPGETTYYRADKGEPWQYIWIGFSAEIELPRVLTTEDVIYAPYLKEEFSSAYYDDFFDKKHSLGTYEYFLCGKIWQILGKLLSLNKKPLSAYESYIRPAIGMMQTEYNNTLTVEDIAAKLNISYGYFEQLFKSETGTTPKKYLNVLRLRKAVQLITRRNCSVTVAAASVGYADVFAFSRAFKNHYGVSPSEYKKAYLEEKQVTLIRSKDILRGELRSMVEEK